MAQVVGCGIDIEERDRFTRHLESGSGVPGFIEMVFTEEEISRNQNTLPLLTFPLGFSCKEAVFKAFGKSWTNSELSWKDIEVIFNDSENLQDHSIRLGGAAASIYEEMKCDRIESIFTFDQEIVISEVLCVSH